jgi:hypothetical protein
MGIHAGLPWDAEIGKGLVFIPAAEAGLGCRARNDAGSSGNLANVARKP